MFILQTNLQMSQTLEKQPLVIQSDSLEDQNRKKGQAGVSGKLSLPIRIFTFLWLCANITISNLFDTENAEVAKKYQLYVTPPGLFFSIWALIFTLQAIVNFINIFKNFWTLNQHLLLAINNFLLLLWTDIFNSSNNPAIFISFFILLSITPITLLFWKSIGNKPVNWYTYLSRNTYALYLGWVVAATNLNLGMIIVYIFGASQKAQLIIFWIVAPLCAIGITGGILRSQKLYGLKSCIALWISVAWAFTGAAISSSKNMTNQ